MHILLVHQNFAAIDEPGGTRHHELARYLVQQGHRVTVISSPVSYLTGSRRSQADKRSAAAGLEGFTHLRVYTYSALHRSFFHRLLSFFSFMASSFLAGLRLRQVDLVWGTSPPIFQGLTAWALARIKGVPFVFEVRDLWPAFAVAVGVLRSRVLVRLSEWLEGFLYRQSRLLIINSPGFEEHVRERGARWVEVVPNGADPRMFSPQESGAAFRQQHHLGDKFIAMYAGAHGMSNDLEIVLQSAAHLRDRPDIQIVLLGDGKDRPKLQQLAREMRLENVTFLPPVAKQEMSQALAAADACIAILKPVRMYETVYPNKVFDYMAAGKPVVLAIGGVIRQVVEEARAGIFVPPGNAQALAQAVRTLADDPSEGKEMGQRGREYLEAHFDRALLAQKLEKLFQKSLSSKNKV
jgi:glycosyltransferase involved in cell wall biosynthesis